MSYQPPKEIVARYARLLVEFALADGRGVQPGEVVYVIGAEDTKPLFVEVCRAVWRAGGNVIQRFEPADDDRFNLDRIFFEEAGDEQLDHFTARYHRGLVDDTDHLVYISGERDPKALEGVSSEKLLRRQASRKPLVEWQHEKERAGAFHWTIALWGTEGMAAEAGVSLEDYWEQIIRACHLDDPDPIERWRETIREIERYRDWLNSLPIQRVHVEAEGTDLWLTLGQRRRWIGGSGRNIPSFEIFTSPDWRETEGHISFSEPLYVYGSLVKGVRLEFKDGRVIKATADENQELIEQIVAAEGGDKVGEFSLTDARLSRIDRFMADTLYDENMGGPFGNTHLAVGMSITDTFDGDEAGVSDEEWEQLGYNNSSPVHTDIVSTTDRTVTAVLADGSERVIYAGGHFQVD